MKKHILLFLQNLIAIAVLAQAPLKKSFTSTATASNTTSNLASSTKWLRNSNLPVHNQAKTSINKPDSVTSHSDLKKEPKSILATKQITQLHYDEFWMSGSIGAGGVLSSNIANTGAVLPFRTEFTWQRRHRRLGFGIGKELYLTPQSLVSLALGKSPTISKLYFVYEKFLFRNFPINLGFSSHLGFFSAGGTKNNNSSNTNGTNTTTTTGNSTNSNASGGLFGNAGLVLEAGIRPFYLFVRPDIEYQSWSGLHKQIQATVSAGIRLKFLSKEEKERRASKKAARHNKKKKK